MIDEPETEEEIAERLRKRKRSLVRAAIASVLAIASLSTYLYVRYGVKKEDLGGPCSFAMNCKTTAPQCLRLTLDGEGACSRPCDPGADCAPGIRCVKVGLEERDDRGVPLEGGYCIPQTLLDARKRALHDGGVADAGHVDSWLPVPQIENQLEGEITLQTGSAEPKTYTVKGTLLRAGSASAGGKKRTIVDASTLRLFFVDDEKQTFSVVAMGGAPGDITVKKTGATDTIDGQACDAWQLLEGKTTREVCVLTGGAFVDPAARVASPWTRELAVRGAFPLRVVELDGKGHETSRTVATHVARHAVDTSLFAIPHAYRNLAGN